MEGSRRASSRLHTLFVLNPGCMPNLYGINAEYDQCMYHLTAVGRLVRVLVTLVLALLLDLLQLEKVAHDRIPRATAARNLGLGGNTSWAVNTVVLHIGHGRPRGRPHDVDGGLLLLLQDIRGSGDAELRREGGASLRDRGATHAHAFL